MSITDRRASRSRVEGGVTPVTIIVPCCNEAEGLPHLAPVLSSVAVRLAPRYQVRFLLVDDGSTDDTWRLLERHFGGRADCRLLRHEQNRGLAAAIATGLHAAETEIVCSMDADCTYDPHELAEMIPLLDEGAALVTASPYHPEGGVKNVAAWRLGLSRGASWLYRRVLGRPLHTYTSCFRVYRRSAVLDLPVEEQGFLGVAELLARAVQRGDDVVEYPTVLDSRRYGRSKMKVARTVWGHLRLLARLARRHESPPVHPHSFSSPGSRHD